MKQLQVLFFSSLLISVSLGQVKAKVDTSKFIPLGVSEISAIPDEMPIYPGGQKELAKFIIDAFINKISLSNSEAQIFQTPVARWTIDEIGNVVDVKIIRTSNVSKIDQLFIQTIKKMPKWIPAKLNGQPVKSDWTFPLRICFK
jgi:protein TonB